MKESAKRAARPGPKPRWGERQQVSVKWPIPHREVYEREAAKLGISFNEYVVRQMARQHGLLDDENDGGQEQLPLGA
ncbi:hypothetical protein PSD17_02990 [Pseudonocardia sp. D17]|jgi:hypothetical protein|nr:hypothetical protein PSD17_02990 [Pseudonocardia sp. D17]